MCMTTEPDDKVRRQQGLRADDTEDERAVQEPEEPRHERSSISSPRPAARGPRDRGSRF
jgi:hypothetical protein